MPTYHPINESLARQAKEMLTDNAIYAAKQIPALAPEEGDTP